VVHPSKVLTPLGTLLMPYKQMEFEPVTVGTDELKPWFAPWFG
jgi:hypothetical protein